LKQRISEYLWRQASHFAGNEQSYQQCYQVFSNSDKIQITTKLTEGCVLFSVRDYGIGIPRIKDKVLSNITGSAEVEHTFRDLD
jgi:hypothetical protein